MSSHGSGTARVRPLLQAVADEMRAWSLNYEYSVARRDLEAAIEGYVAGVAPSIDYEYDILPKIGQLKLDLTRMGAAHLAFVLDDVDGAVEELSDDEPSDDDTADKLRGEIEELVMEIADLRTQASRISNRVDCGLKKHIDNLIASAAAK